jgi:hypothetical protein
VDEPIEYIHKTYSPKPGIGLEIEFYSEEDPSFYKELGINPYKTVLGADGQGFPVWEIRLSPKTGYDLEKSIEKISADIEIVLLWIRDNFSSPAYFFPHYNGYDLGTHYSVSRICCSKRSANAALNIPKYCDNLWNIRAENRIVYPAYWAGDDYMKFHKDRMEYRWMPSGSPYSILEWLKYIVGIGKFPKGFNYYEIL